MRKTTSQHKYIQTGSTLADLPRFILLDDRKEWVHQLGANQTFICTNNVSILNALQWSTSDMVWISSHARRIESLAKTIGKYMCSSGWKNKCIGNLFMLETPREQVLPLLHEWFSTVVGGVSSYVWLPTKQLIEVLSALEKKSQDVFVGGIADIQTKTLTLVRGNLKTTTVPFSIFRQSGVASPDFERFELDDYGHTLRFGDYEAIADVVLWETDPDYRKRMKVKEREHAEGFGASLRRLRIQRGLTQADFPGISRRTIARIENGEIQKPHVDTQRQIAKTLGVEAEDIKTY